MKISADCIVTTKIGQVALLDWWHMLIFRNQKNGFIFNLII